MARRGRRPRRLTGRPRPDTVLSVRGSDTQGWRTGHGLAALAALACACAVLAESAAADTIEVPGDSPTIQGAEDIANPGDRIQIRKAKVFPENVEVDVADLTIEGTVDGVRVDAAGGGGGFAFDVNATGFTLRGLTALHADGIQCVGVGCVLSACASRGR